MTVSTEASEVVRLLLTEAQPLSRSWGQQTWRF